jgi:hypothetical protein
MDNIIEYFLHKIEEFGLCSVEPVRLMPTWRNFKVGEESISKRLDRFLIC